LAFARLGVDRRAAIRFRTSAVPGCVRAIITAEQFRAGVGEWVRDPIIGYWNSYLYFPKWRLPVAAPWKEKIKTTRKNR
jgi:hypothetical protein